MKRLIQKLRGGAKRRGLQRRGASSRPLRRSRRLGSERLESRQLLAGDFHNLVFPPDVNADGTATVADLVGVITQLRNGGPRDLSASALGEGEARTFGDRLYVDVNDDSRLSLGDALDVVFALRGEGEAMATDDMFGLLDPDPFTVLSNSGFNNLPVLDNDMPSNRLEVIGVGTLAQLNDPGLLPNTTITTDFGGTVEVFGTGVGNSVRYRPAPDFFGQDRFIYEIRDTQETDPDLATDRAVVTVFVEPGPDEVFVTFTYQFLDPETRNPITQVEQGETFIVQAFVQDTRDMFQPAEDRGVAAAALDLAYTSNLGALVVVNPNTNPHMFDRDFVFGPEYRALVNVDNFEKDASPPAGLLEIDEISAAQTDLIDPNDPTPDPLGPDPVLFFEAVFQATSPPSGTGVFTVAGNPADDPLNQIVVLEPGQLDPVPPDAVEYGTAQLTVVAARGAVADAFTRNEDLAPGAGDLDDPILDVLANDTNLDGTPLGANAAIIDLNPALAGNQTQITLPSGSTVSITAGGRSLTYDPAPNFFGVEAQFSYTLRDGNNQTDSAPVTITVLPIADDPIAVDDVFGPFNEGSPQTTLPVLNNDLDPDTGNNTGITITGLGLTTGPTNLPNLTLPSGATVSIATGGRTLLYTPGNAGTDSFRYMIQDADGRTDTATVTVNVVRIDQDAAVTLMLTDLNGNPLPVVGGVPQLNIGQQFQVMVLVEDLRDPNDPEEDIELGLGLFSAFIDLTWFGSQQLLEFVGPVTFGPQYNNPEFRDFGDTSVDGLIDDVGSPQTNLLSGPVGAGQFKLFTAVLAAEGFGAATISTEPADEIGHEIQTFDPPNILSPADVIFDSITVNIINPNPDQPIANPDAYSVRAGDTLVVNTREAGVLGNDIDPGGDNTIQAQLVDATDFGVLNLNPNGTFTYTPNANFVGTDTFTYRAVDDGLASAPVTVTITVLADTGVAVSGFVYTDEDASRVMETDERRLGGVTVTLQRLRQDGTVDPAFPALTTKTAADGSYAFDNLTIGQRYRITAQQPAFMIDGWDSLNDQIFVGDSIDFTFNGVGQRVDFGEQGLRGEFVTPRDFFGQADPNGFQIATNAGGSLGSEHWFSFFDGWAGFTKAEAQISADGTRATIRVTRQVGATTETFVLSNVAVGVNARIRLLGRMGDGVVLRFEGTPAQFLASGAVRQ